MSALDEQRFFARWVLQPEPIAELVAERAEPGLHETVRAADEATAIRRLAIYHRMYFARLHESLAEDFPAVRAAVGAAEFERICAELLCVAPSRGPGLRAVGRPLPAFLRRRAHTRPDLAELAALEWARTWAFDARDDRPLSLADVIACGDRLGELAVVAPSGTRIVVVRHDIDAVWRAADRGEPVPAAQRSPGRIVVWKRELLVWHRRIDDVERGAMLLLLQGTTIAAICEALAPATDAAAAAEVWARLQRWIDDGLLVARVPNRAHDPVRQAGTS